MLSDPAFGAACALGAALAWSVTSLLARTLMPYDGSHWCAAGFLGERVSAWTVPGAVVAVAGIVVRQR